MEHVLDHLDSPVGRLAIVADDTGALRVLAFVDRLERPEHAAAAAARPVANPFGLTDRLRAYFAGELAFLARVRDRVALPLLRKDFTIDAYQIAEARAAGADAVLLIVAALSASQLRELAAAAAEYGLAALVEVHDLAEADVALAAGVQLLGVNHRDLKTMTMDMTLTSTIAPRVPPGTILVGESGIRSSADVRALGEAGAHAILVGEHLMRQPSPGTALRELIAGAGR